VTHYLFTLFFAATSVWAGDNLAHEKLSRAEKFAKAQIDHFLNECSTYPSYKVRIEISQDNLTATELVKEAKKKVKAAFTPNPELTDTEIFPHGGDGNMVAEEFQSTNFDKARNAACASKVRTFNRKYDVQGVIGKKKDLSIVGYVLQKKFEKNTTLFYLVSEPFFDYSAEPTIEVGNDPGKGGVDDFEVTHKLRTFLTDQDLVDYLHFDDGKLSKVERQQLLVARAQLIAWANIGKELAAGEYLEKEVNWELSKVTHKESGEKLVAAHFSGFDDDGYTVFFKPGSLKIAYIYYEN